MESFTVEAILSAVDKNFTSTMKDADNSMGGLNENTKKTNTSILDIAKGIGVFKLVDSAINMVKSSTEGAIRRFDTLKQYPVVMDALGYSTEEVDRSMNKLTDGIDGLPTSLDEIVASTQQLAISTGSLDKGTDTAIALNNAMLASGSSSADAARGIEQYRQMLARGEVDMQSWRSVQDTMPVAMDKVAKSFEDRGVTSVNELYDALKAGNITFDEFNDRLIELNEGVDGFAELAKKNSAGIQTSFDNIKTAVVKGLANVIQAVDDGMQNAGFGSIAENLDKVKDAINTAFNALNENLPAIIEKVGNAFKFLADNSEWLIPLISGVAGALLAVSAVNSATNTITNITKAVGSLSSAFAFLMSPTGLIIIGIGLLIAAGVALYKNWDTISEYAKNIWNGISDFFKDTFDNIKGWFSDLWEGTKEKAATAADGVKQVWQDTKQWFADLWQGIKDSATDMWEGTKQAFSDGVDSIVSVWDGITQWFSDLWNGIKSTVTSIVQGIADGIMSRFGTLVYGVRNAFIHMSFFLRTLWTNLAKIAGQIFEIMKNVILAPVLFVTSLISGGWEEAKNNMIGIWNNIQTAALEIWTSITAIFDSFLVNTKMAFLNIWNGIKAALEYIWTTIQTIATETFNSMVAFFVETWTNIKQGTIDAWEGLKTWLSETWDSIKQIAMDTWNSVKQFFVDLWESIKTNTINMWNGIKDGVTTTWENTKNAVINIATGLVDGANQAWENMKTGVSNAVDRVKETFDTIREIDLLQIGKDIIDGLVKGIRSKIDDVVSAVQDVANTITGKVKDILNIHSPSRVMAELGVFTSQGLAEGMLDGSKYVEKASDTLADKASNMDIGNRISAVNSQIQTQVQHEVSYGTNNKPAIFNVRIGDSEFSKFVDDISQAQGNGINLNMQF
ncbi:phage tail protein [Enterococcus entomosocium]|uniref:phage tail protein n=2 Tax=Enterococcus entomosocium TaxID=3034352 RepID=UPI0026485706|nr:tape measure protein [Enterococcus entomosocium]